MKRNELRLRIFEEHTPESFLQLALDIFNYQFENNTYYRTFVEWYNDKCYFHLIGFLVRIK